MAQKVLFKRKTSQQIEELPIEDGSLIYNVENGKTYMDYGNDRIQTGGNAETMIAITENEPTDEDIKLWIPTNVSNTKASEVVDSLDGNQTNYAPSIRAVNEAMHNISGTILWTNPNPISDFAEQEITLNDDDYDLLEWIYLDDKNVGGYSSIKNPKGTNAKLNSLFTYEGNVYNGNRICTYQSDISYLVGASVGYSNSNNSTQVSTSQCIPIYIIGYKTGLFS